MKKALTIIAILFCLQSFAQVKIVKDTVVINSVSGLNWIKIDGEIYQIKKMVAIQKFEVLPSRNLEWGPDTVMSINPRWYSLPQNNLDSGWRWGNDTILHLPIFGNSLPPIGATFLNSINDKSGNMQCDHKLCSHAIGIYDLKSSIQSSNTPLQFDTKGNIIKQ